MWLATTQVPWPDCPTHTTGTFCKIKFRIPINFHQHGKEYFPPPQILLGPLAPSWSFDDFFPWWITEDLPKCSSVGPTSPVGHGMMRCCVAPRADWVSLWMILAMPRKLRSFAARQWSADPGWGESKNQVTIGNPWWTDVVWYCQMICVDCWHLLTVFSCSGHRNAPRPIWISSPGCPQCSAQRSSRESCGQIIAEYHAWKWDQAGTYSHLATYFVSMSEHKHLGNYLSRPISLTLSLLSLSLSPSLPLSLYGSRLSNHLVQMYIYHIILNV